jgi:hypothetical protein
VRKYLAFAEERDGGDGGREDDAVVDQVPEAEDALQMGLGGRLGYGWIFDCGHGFAGEYMRKASDGKAILSD